MADEYTSKFKIDITDLKKGMQEANQIMRVANSEFKAATGGMDKWGDSADGLSAKLKQLNTVHDAQSDKLELLQAEYARVVKAEGENSKGAQDLYIKMNNLKGEIGKTEAQISKYSTKLNDVQQEQEQSADSAKEAESATNKLGRALDDAGESADEAESKFAGFSKVLAGGIATGLKAVGAAAVGLVGAFLATGEASQEYVEDMGKLEAGFTSAGHSAETAQKAYRDMVGVLGETDQSVEAVNHLAKLTQNQEELAQWTDIATGIYATFGDSLPIEGLTEAANETAKVGQVTGPLADALNWAGEGEDEFNKKLAACNSEQERATLITETLNGLYQDAADKYKDVNGDLIEARQAQSDLNAAMAETGRLAMPITTAFKQISANLLKEFLPSIKAVRDAFLGVLGADVGADVKLGESIANILTDALGKITEMLPTLATVGLSIVTSLVQGIINAAPRLLTTGTELLTFLYNSIMTGLPKLIQSGSQIITKLGEGIRTNLPNFVSTALDALDGFADMLTTNLPILINAGISFITNLAQGLVSALPVFISKAPEIITKFANLINDNAPKLLAAAVNIIAILVKGIISAIPTLVKSVPEIIKAFVAVWTAFNWASLGKNAIKFLKNGITSMMGAIKTAATTINNAAVNVIKQLPGKLLSFGKSAVSNLGNALKSGISIAKSAVSSISNAVVNTLKSVPGKMLSIGKDIVKGLWNGISDMTGWVISKIRGFGDSVLSGLKSFFKIASPSKLMRDEIGKWIPAGIAEGIDKNTKSAVNATKNMAKKLMPVTESVLTNVNGATSKIRQNSSGVTGSRIVQNFYQYNNSPKALSRLEIYRQTKNQLAFAKGV